ncbi:hypothetical protein KAR91_43510 [Candidatus Pacearchaeota archaeon]|nr:hypothetical protein [Candidatus Pacearchaeota archaeon]
MKRNLKNIDTMDIGLAKLSAMAFVLFLINVWPAAMTLVHSIHWGWFLVAFVIFAARPILKAYK